MDTQSPTTIDIPSKSITILVSIYQAGAFLHAKIKNLLQIENFEDCWIVLLNCQDLHNESLIYADFVGQHPNVLEIKYSQHINLYPTWNDGIAITNSRYIMNSNVDDMLHPEYVRTCTRYLDENHDVSVVSSKVLMTDTPNQIWPEWDWCDQMPFHAYPLSSAGPCPVWRRSLHDKYGYFNDFRVIGDARMWEKWYAGGEKFGLIDKQLVLYLRNPHSLERRADPITGVSLRDLDLQ